jgi:ADP-dependent phosphofructokinase/glucokinase
MEEMADFLDDEEFKSTGIHRGEVDIVMVPNKVFKNPKLTVGLGDIVSASSFALENALR